MMPKDPVSGYSVRFDRFREEFVKFLQARTHPDGVRAIVAWLFRYASFSGISHSHISAIVEQTAKTNPECREALLHALHSLTENEIATAAHPPEFEIGQRVQVILNARNLTPHAGTILTRVWHHKNKKWNYTLLEGDKRIAKRYFFEDLLPT